MSLDHENLRAMLLRHEGRRFKPYKCTSNKTTIGIGRNLDDVGLSEDEVQYLFTNDCERATLIAGRIPLFHKLDAVRKCALIDMAFQMGYAVKDFKKALAAMRVSDWQKAHDELLDSRWAKQTPHRANEIADMILTGEWQE